jgi:hypothetical protein
MARRRPRNGVAFPLSGNVTQAINPWAWWFKFTGNQVGFINVYEMQSSDSEQERKIVEEVASYGKQLGRIVEALSAVLRHERFTESHLDEEPAIKRFLEMADQISALKGDVTAPSEAIVDRFLARMSRIRQQDPQSYRMLRQKLLEGLKPEMGEE